MELLSALKKVKTRPQNWLAEWCVNEIIQNPWTCVTVVLIAVHILALHWKQQKSVSLCWHWVILRDTWVNIEAQNSAMLSLTSLWLKPTGKNKQACMDQNKGLAIPLLLFSYLYCFIFLCDGYVNNSCDSCHLRILNIPISSFMFNPPIFVVCLLGCLVFLLVCFWQGRTL